MTGLEAIEGALEELGLLIMGDSADSDFVAFGLKKLNRMLNSWSADGFNLHARIEENFNLAYGKASYTIGKSAGADVDSVRPNFIEQAFIRDSNGHDHHVGILGISQYWGIGEKSTISRPKWLFYDPTYPNGTIYTYPASGDTEEVHIVSQKPITNLTSTATEIILPPEYQDAIVCNLAVSMAPAYGKDISSETMRAARNGYANMRARNLANSMKPAVLNLPGRRGGAYNVDEG